jgi:steroid 5-alpha reductase family enzyme
VTVAALIIAVSVGLSLAMMGAWLVQHRTRNGGWADAVWTFALGIAGGAYALVPLGAPPTSRQVLIATLIAIWAVRLGIHLALRTRRGPEDSRYAQFRCDWGAAYERRMFWFLQIQAAAAAFLALTILVAARNPSPLGYADLFGCVLIAISYGGEAVADRQLRHFRETLGNRGRVCDRGLWRWSRHPNYFFEWLGWVAYLFFAIRPGSYAWGWIALTGPAFIYYLLVYVSGIPPLEQQMLSTRSDAFRAYQARTRAFFPLPLGRMS